MIIKRFFYLYQFKDRIGTTVLDKNDKKFFKKVMNRFVNKSNDDKILKNEKDTLKLFYQLES